MNLVNDSQFTKILPNQSLPLKYFECRGELIDQFITAKSLVSIHSPIFCLSNILPHTVFKLFILRMSAYSHVQCGAVKRYNQTCLLHKIPLSLLY